MSMRILSTLALFFLAAPAVQVEDPVPAIVWALRLPALVTEARQSGIADTAVRAVLDEFRRRGLGADEAAQVVREEVDAVQAGGPKDNFGAFVHQQLEAGLRGRALAKAIRAEHEARGIGHPKRGTGQGRDTLRPHGGMP
jgi:hypothetical protein